AARTLCSGAAEFVSGTKAKRPFKRALSCRSANAGNIGQTQPRSGSRRFSLRMGERNSRRLLGAVRRAGCVRRSVFRRELYDPIWENVTVTAFKAASGQRSVRLVWTLNHN